MKFSRRAMLGGTAAASLPFFVPFQGEWGEAHFGAPAAICAASSLRAAIAAAFDEAARRNAWASGPVVTLALPWVRRGMSRLILRVAELSPVFAWDVAPAAEHYDEHELAHALDSASRTGARLLLVRDDPALVERLRRHTDLAVRSYSRLAGQMDAFEEPLSAELARALGRPEALHRLTRARALPLTGDDVAALFPAEAES